MKTENTLDTINREFLEMFRTETQALSFKTSNVLYYGKAATASEVFSVPTGPSSASPVPAAT